MSGEKMSKVVCLIYIVRIKTTRDFCFDSGRRCSLWGNAAMLRKRGTKFMGHQGIE